MSSTEQTSLEGLITLAKMKEERPEEYRKVLKAIKDVYIDLAKLSKEVLEELE